MSDREKLRLWSVITRPSLSMMGMCAAILLTADLLLAASLPEGRIRDQLISSHRPVLEVALGISETISGTIPFASGAIAILCFYGIYIFIGCLLGTFILAALGNWTDAPQIWLRQCKMLTRPALIGGGIGWLWMTIGGLLIIFAPNQEFARVVTFIYYPIFAIAARMCELFVELNIMMSAEDGISALAVACGLGALICGTGGIIISLALRLKKKMPPELERQRTGGT